MHEHTTRALSLTSDALLHLSQGLLCCLSLVLRRCLALLLFFCRRRIECELSAFRMFTARQLCVLIFMPSFILFRLPPSGCPGTTPGGFRCQWQVRTPWGLEKDFECTRSAYAHMNICLCVYSRALNLQRLEVCAAGQCSARMDIDIVFWGPD